MSLDTQNSVPDLKTAMSQSASEAKQKKKKMKLMESLLRELPHDAGEDAKLDLLCHKYLEATQDKKETTNKIKQLEQAIQSLGHERDQLMNERNRLVLQKDKLENLCRELQKQNKFIQEESVSRARAEEEKRREVSEHFQSSITSIQNQLNQYQTRNTELRKENQDLAEKLTEFIKQHEKREEHIEKVIQTRNLETKLAEAKLTKAQCLLDQEKVKSQQQILKMEEEAKLMQNRMDMHLAVEDKLKEQIQFYKEKYQTFNKTMSESRQLFDNAKLEMEKLGKRVRMAEREAVEWQAKWELSQRSLLELADERKKEANKAAAAQKQVEKLGGLCRALQAQLTELRSNGAASSIPSTNDTKDSANSEHAVSSESTEPGSNDLPDSSDSKDPGSQLSADSTVEDGKPESTVAENVQSESPPGASGDSQTVNEAESCEPNHM